MIVNRVALSVGSVGTVLRACRVFKGLLKPGNKVWKTRKINATEIADKI